MQNYWEDYNNLPIFVSLYNILLNLFKKEK